MAVDYPEWIPTVDELGALMRARTTGGSLGATEQGTFNESTRPTGEQAQRHLTEAADIVIPQVGEVTGRAANLAKAATLRWAAMTVEQTYFPEQQQDQRQSPYANYRREYLDLLAAAEKAAAEVDADGDSDAGEGGGAYGTFPSDSGWDAREF